MKNKWEIAEEEYQQALKDYNNGLICKWQLNDAKERLLENYYD